MRINSYLRPAQVVLLLAAVALAPQQLLGLPKPHRFPGIDIDPSQFVLKVDNKFFPLEPGTTFSYEGETEGTPTTDVTYVGHETELILGVTCVVVHDDAYEDGVLVETTIDWYAQDIYGNVWYFGEDTKELDEDGNVVTTEGSWKGWQAQTPKPSGATEALLSEREPTFLDLRGRASTKQVNSARHCSAVAPP